METMDAAVLSDAPVRKKKWKNRERVLVFCSRGASYRHRHLMTDLRALLPHAKAESKMDSKQNLGLINEMCEMKNCTKCVYLETRKRTDLYMWVSAVGDGPSAKFRVHNVHTMSELRLSGNCLKGSRPVLSFDASFDVAPHCQLIKELFIQTFGTPRYHPRSQPFVDRVFSFSLTDDGKIWFRHYQLVDEASAQLEEIGPRFVLELIKVFDGSFGGAVLYENTSYLTPNVLRRQHKLAAKLKYTGRLDAKESLDERRRAEAVVVKSDPLDALFRAAPDGAQAARLKHEIETEPERPPPSKRKRNTDI